jgi:phosphoglycerol transferase MdoB-like AlkP superfamily enzyme
LEIYDIHKFNIDMAPRYIANLIKLFIYYLLLFAVCRLIYLLYFTGDIAHEGAGIFPLALYEAIRLDISTACYLLFIPSLLLLAGSFISKYGMHKALKIYLLFTSFFYIALAVIEIAIYREVHVKLYFNLLTHLEHPSELILSVPWVLLFTVFALIILLSYACFKVLGKLFPIPRNRGSKPDIKESISLVSTFLLTVTLLVIGCRGGLQPIPINEGEGYFSDNQCVNDGTVNPLWNITHSFIEHMQVLKGNAYKVMPDSLAEGIVKELYHVEQDTTVALFTISKPNVCFLILESWSADVIASLGGYENLTPNFEKLITEGYLFTHIKPAGHLSDQGIPAVLSGYPALPIGSAINQPERQVYLPCINNQFKEAGYHSSFFFGGQLIYGNIKSYIYRNKFDRVIEQKDLPSSFPSGRLGIHDSLMLNLWLDSINAMKVPFLSGLFTLSTHAPYDEPSPHSTSFGGSENSYLNSIIYADKQIGKFFEAAKKQSWYDSTIFILVADHSHNVPKNYDSDSPEYYRIPLLVCGGTLKREFRGAKNDRIGSQTDIASTLLHQLGYKSDDFRWSKNLMNPYTQPFAFYTFSEGFGYADTTGTVTWNKIFPGHNKNTGRNQEEKDALYKKGSAMLQILMNDYLSK